MGFTHMTHGHKRGGKETSEYRAYTNAKQRCLNPNHNSYAAYGGRGIEFRFTSFQEFLAEVGLRPPGMLLDRKDNDGHYEPGNVRWVTYKQSAQNRRNDMMGKRQWQMRQHINPKYPFRGVRLHHRGNRWQAELSLDYKKIHLGMFATAEEAARAYDAAVREHYGEDAVTNFPKVQ